MKKTPELFSDYLNAMIEALEQTEKPSEEMLQRLEEVAMALSESMMKDAVDAERWRKFEADIAEAWSAVMFKPGDVN